MREAFLQHHLQRVVGGVGNRVFGEDVGEDRNAIDRAAGAGKRIAVRGRITTQADKVETRERCSGRQNGWTVRTVG